MILALVPYVQIESIVDLPVGENLQSHAGPGGLYFSFTQNSGLYIPELLTTDFLPELENYLKTGGGRSAFNAFHAGASRLSPGIDRRSVIDHACLQDYPSIEDAWTMSVKLRMSKEMPVNF